MSASKPNRETQPITLTGPEAAPQPPARPRWHYWLGGSIAVLILAGATLSYLRERPASGPLTADRAQKDIPPTLRPYYDRAINGDASAMRMLGTMYYNGLNVPQDTKEGVRWYRKAAAAGSVAATKDLEQLGLTPSQ